jgi:hypothetical protein
MMFLEVSKTVCVNTKEICWVSSEQEGLSSMIYVGGKEYPCDIPYSTLVSMLKDSDGDRTMKKLDEYLSVATIQTV